MTENFGVTSTLIGVTLVVICIFRLSAGNRRDMFLKLKVFLGST